jgi:hypothetical protein
LFVVAQSSCGSKHLPQSTQLLSLNLKYLKLIGTKEVTPSQTNGQIERLNGTFKNLLRNLTGGVIGTPWTACTIEAAHQYNNKLHATIKRTPFEVLRGCMRYAKLEDSG